MTTTTTFIGDIKFNDGETDRLVSDLATVDEVNEAFTKYYDKTQCDSKFALKDDIGNTIDAYTKTECDSKFALKVNGYTESIMSLSTSSYSSETTYNASVGDRFRLGTRIGGGAVQYYTVILTDEFNTQAGQKIEVEAYYFTITFNQTYTRLVFRPNSNELVLNNLVLEVPNNVVYNNEVYTKTECDDKFALKNPSTTITHYAPIEEPIANYHIGCPTFMSGKVYKRDDNTNTVSWIQSTPNDSIDCICSCITTGNSKTFAGIITSIDSKNNSITFATHGDYLFKVNDSSKYNVGDTICYDGSVIVDNTIPTIAIQQSIIGQVSSIIDSTTLAVLKTS